MWDSDPEKYVEDDDEDSMNYTVRTGAMELLLEMGAELRNSYVEALVRAITKHVAECGPLTEGYNWKVCRNLALSID